MIFEEKKIMWFSGSNYGYGQEGTMSTKTTANNTFHKSKEDFIWFVKKEFQDKKSHFHAEKCWEQELVIASLMKFLSYHYSIYWNKV